MLMKVVVVGCTHAGTAAVRELLTRHPETEVDVFERREDISFLSCGIALYLEGTVGRLEDMFYATPASLEALGPKVHVHLKHDVLSIDAVDHQVVAEDLATGQQQHYQYDKLIMTTGSYPVIPPISGVSIPRVLMCKSYDDARKIKESAKDADKIAIVGGGYIGVELAEAYSRNHKQVILINGVSPLLSHYVDLPLSKEIASVLTKRGVELKTNTIARHFDSDEKHVFIQTDQGEIQADLAVVCVGFRPMTELLVGQVEMNPDGAIHVNDYMQTSNPDIYAAGDAVAVHFNPTGKDAYAPLATNAVRQGKMAGANIFGQNIKYMGTQATSALKLYDHSLAVTGLTLAHAKRNHLPAVSVTMTDDFRPPFMPHTVKITMVLVYDTRDRRILGAQFYSQYDIANAANLISVMIQNRNTIDQLAYVDMLFNPNYDKPWHYLNLLGQLAVMQADNAKL
ncbi:MULTISPECIES: FAD-dependent oxidoreductase [Lacticaseibacillus]|uniref:FAD-dependent oxidoreductase n=3 Tax=Lacticaseibacillus TaxID=2759736 RepID=A0AAN1C606_LACCA|nr:MULTISPECIES: FAD-dependent oxidoreductase [Lacticaseibacillus]ARY90383.1 NADH oxidase [Lacticaseibacillus casei]WLV81003.1 FAD-dependent oxidoreductase [Lacticaseibacillus sp. NCIMB 15473]WNX24962.1 FAD-dependent oxidoreductase [Lacticaseibacillus casei]WNX27733.1 FAD-dependent oxidoreductase [Lacticaseibacillus casei]